MRTSGLVRWFDRGTGVGVVALDDGGADCVVIRLDRDAAAPAGGGGTVAHVAERAAERPTPHPAGRDRWLDLAAALRAGTWGDGGRDY